MSIQVEDIKLMASQRLADTDDGGGDMTGREVISGELNNLFPDISRWDRAYGRVSLREAFVSVQTQNTDTYSGSHVILSAPAKDPAVNVCLFKTGNPYDVRGTARDYIERYVVRGSRFAGWLWSLHPAGSRSLLIFAVRGTRAPNVGEVLYLSGGTGQYVRITKVSVTRFDDMLSSAASAYYSRDIFEIGIADPLNEDQPGLEISANNSQATSIYTTVVNNSAKYYGVMLPTKAIAAGDVAINVDSIYTRLVPSAQAETPLNDLSVGEINPVIGSGTPVTLNLGVVSAGSGTLLHLNRGIAPGSLAVSAGARSFIDKGDGLIYEGETQRGTIDYATGQLTWGTLGQNFNVNTSATCVIATAVNQLANTHSHPITLASQSNSYTMILEPPPSPGTVRVDYMAQGQWYRLRDNGAGLLKADIEGTGTGKLNYQSGQLILTCGALPDVGSRILYAWAAPLEIQDASGEVELGNAELQHQCASAPIKPGTVEIVWQTINGEASLVDDGHGTLAGDGTGRINYALGRLFWQPGLLVSEGGYTLRYHISGGMSEGVGGQVAGGVGVFRLSRGSVRPGSVSMSLTVHFSDGSSHIYEFADSGGGSLSAAGGGTEGLADTQPGNQPKVAYSYGDASASVDYTNGVVTLSLAGVSGTRTDYLYEYVKKHSSATGWYWIQRYKGTEVTALSASGMGGMAVCRYSLSNEATEAAEEEVAAIPYTVDLLPRVYGRAIVPGSVDFTWGTTRYIDRMGKLYRNPQASTGQGAEAGEIDYSNGICRLSSPDSAATSISVRSMLTRFGRQMLINAAFRTPGAPLRPAALQIQGVAADGRLVTAMAGTDGTIDGSLCRGGVDYETGIVQLEFGEMVSAAGNENEAWYDVENVISGRIWKPVQVYGDQLVYACVVYSSIPLDASLIGINPARLPVDGRVPIVRSGDVVVIHRSTQTQLPSPLAAGGQVNLGDSAISHVDLVDADGAFVSSALFSLANGVLTMADDLGELAGHRQPLTALARVEDMRLVSQVQINGQVVLTSGVDHSYPVQGTYVSTALPFGDLTSRVYGIFDQKTWGNVWSDSLIGDPAPAGYNEIDYPPLVYNKGAVTERWALVFDSTEHFKIFGERRGVVGDGYISQDCQPLNNATGQPYFLLDRRGWGTGWATGNALRFNTEGANGALWVARTTLQGPVAEASDRFTLQIRGDAQ